MAKKNSVHIMGYVEDILECTDYKILFTVKIKKNENKFVFPIVEASLKVFKELNELTKGNLVIVEGSMKTEQKSESHTCKHCNKIYTETYTLTMVSAQKLFTFNENNSESYINKVLLLGTVCNKPELKKIESAYSMVSNTKYQMAINRKEPNNADYLWVNTFTRQADEDAKRIQVSSQLLVEGALSTRRLTKEYTCVCGEVIKYSQHQTEILGTSVEYLNNCLFEDKKPKENKTQQSEVIPKSPIIATTQTLNNQGIFKSIKGYLVNLIKK